jgi:predicted metal-binding protein
MRDNAKSYPAPWQGRVILVCHKCQKKLKGNDDLRLLAKLKKTVKRLSKTWQSEDYPERALHVINVGCMDLCPKDGVTVCDPARDGGRLRILRDEADVETLFSVE